MLCCVVESGGVCCECCLDLAVLGEAEVVICMDIGHVRWAVTMTSYIWLYRKNCVLSRMTGGRSSHDGNMETFVGLDTDGLS